jgi:hypothetical protein
MASTSTAKALTRSETKNLTAEFAEDTEESASAGPVLASVPSASSAV